MTISEIIQIITSDYENVNLTEANGDFFFLYGEDKMMPFATVVTSDNDFDHLSQLNREGFFRLNIGVSKATFAATFEGLELKKGIGAYADAAFDFAATNLLMPHPLYGAMYWFCIVNPQKSSLPMLKSHLDEAYGIAKRRQEKH